MFHLKGVLTTVVFFLIGGARVMGQEFPEPVRKLLAHIETAQDQMSDLNTLDSALKHVEEARSIGPNIESLQAFLDGLEGQILLKLARLPEARKKLDSAIKWMKAELKGLPPEDAKSRASTVAKLVGMLTSRSQIEAIDGKRVEATRQLTEARAFAAAQAKELAKVESSLVAKIDEQRALLLIELAEELSEECRFDEAISCVHQARQYADNQSGFAALIEVEALIALGNYVNARGVANDLSKVAPNDPDLDAIEKALYASGISGTTKFTLDNTNSKADVSLLAPPVEEGMSADDWISRELRNSHHTSEIWVALISKAQALARAERENECLELLIRLRSHNVTRKQTVPSDVLSQYHAALAEAHMKNKDAKLAFDEMELALAEQLRTTGRSQTAKCRRITELNTQYANLCLDAVLLGPASGTENREIVIENGLRRMEVANAHQTELMSVDGASSPLSLRILAADVTARLYCKSRQWKKALRAVERAIEIHQLDLSAKSDLCSPELLMFSRVGLKRLTEEVLAESEAATAVTHDVYSSCTTARVIFIDALSNSFSNIPKQERTFESAVPRLPPNTTLVEMFSDGQNIHAFVVTNNGSAGVTVRRVRLPSVRECQRLCEAWYSVLLEGAFSENRPSKEQASVRDNVWTPLKIASSCDNIYIIGGGALAELVWPAIQGSQNRFLVRQHRFSTLLSSAHLPSGKRWNAELGEKLLLVTDPDFGPPAVKRYGSLSGSRTIENSLEGPRLPQRVVLSGDRVSAIEVESQLGDHNVGAAVLFSHGEWEINDQGGWNCFEGEIVMAGANSGEETAILVKDVAGSDFSHLKLGVFMVCWGGIGYSLDDSERFSLTEALAYSGCQTTLTPRFQIGVRTSSDFVALALKEFFENGSSIGAAVQKAQVACLDGNKADPLLWAQFQLGGDLTLRYATKQPATSSDSERNAPCQIRNW